MDYKLVLRLVLFKYTPDTRRKKLFPGAIFVSDRIMITQTSTYKTVLPLLLLLTFGQAYAQHQADDLIGIYKDEAATKKIEIYKQQNKYFGKIIDCSTRGNVKVGDVLLFDFVYSNDCWDGYVYLPKRGLNLKAKILIQKDKSLEIIAMKQVKKWVRIQ